MIWGLTLLIIYAVKKYKAGHQDQDSNKNSENLNKSNER